MASGTSIDPALQAELEAVYAAYAALVSHSGSEAGLAGKLLFGGELDTEGCRLIRASNIAGAASLSATADNAAQKFAIRETVIDFLVTSLDEALRILKNEIRKGNAVAVAVSAPALQMMAEMHERGVLPDLLRDHPSVHVADFLSQGAHVIEIPAPHPGGLLMLQSPPAGWEQRALELIPESDYAVRRWLRLSPRYLGPQARRLRSLPSDTVGAAELGFAHPAAS